MRSPGPENSRAVRDERLVARRFCDDARMMLDQGVGCAYDVCASAGSDGVQHRARAFLAFGPGVTPRALGPRETFADIGASLAAHLKLEPTKTGRSWW